MNTVLVVKPTDQNQSILNDHCEWTPEFKAYVCFETVDGNKVPHCEELKTKVSGYAILSIEEYNQAILEKKVQALEEPDSAAIIWLKAKTNATGFLFSMQQNIKKYGKLTPNMLAAVERIYNQELQRASLPKPPSTFENGTILEVSRFVAFELEAVTGHKGFNLELVETVRETEKAIQARVRFTAKFQARCCCCGLKLTNAISKLTGIGPDCAEKMGIPRAIDEDSAREQVKALENVLAQKAEATIWIPRKSIKNHPTSQNETEEKIS